jgi:tRNA(Ile)-lysidine synthase
VDALLANERPQGELHLPRSWVGRRYDRLLVRPVAPEVPTPFVLDVPGPGSYVLPGGGCLRVSVEEVTGLESSAVVEFAAGQIAFPLKVRTFQPGDRFRPSGCGTKKLKSFFIDAKIPREERMRLPLLVGSELLWVIGLRRCSGYRPEVAGEKVLRVHFTASVG